MAKQVIEEKKDLHRFQWDNEESVNYFGVEKNEEEVLTKEEQEALKNKKEDGMSKKTDNKEESDTEDTNTSEEDTSEEEVIEKKTEEEEEETKEKDKETEEKPPEPFSEELEEIEKKEETPKEEEQQNEDEFFTNLATGLKERGILSVDVPADKKLTEDDFINLQDEEVDSRVRETFERFFDELDEDGKNFLKYKRDGGNTTEFFDMLKRVSVIPQGDIEDESYQKQIITFYEKNIEGTDEEEINEKLEFLETSGRLRKRAESCETKANNFKEKQEKELQNKVETEEKNREESEKKFKENLKTNLDKIEEVKGFTISDKEKTELFKYISNPSIKTGKNKFMTSFQSDLKKVSENFETFILLAKLIKSDFDTSSITKKTVTKQSLNLKEKLSNTQTSSKPNVSSGNKGKSLADYFD